jgi:hypothetical protein
MRSRVAEWAPADPSRLAARLATPTRAASSHGLQPIGSLVRSRKTWGSSRRAFSLWLPLTLTLSPQAGRGDPVGAFDEAVPRAGVAPSAGTSRWTA